jgi:hypothetical protein
MGLRNRPWWTMLKRWISDELYLLSGKADKPINMPETLSRMDKAIKDAERCTSSTLKE